MTDRPRAVSLAAQRQGYDTFIARLDARPFILPGLVLALANAWALQYICAKVLGDRDVPVFGCLFIVHVAMVAVFGAVLLRQRRLFRFSLARIVFFACASGLGNIISLAAELEAAPHIPAGLLAIIIALAPVFTLLFTALLRTERIGVRRFAGLGLGMTASLCILLPHAEFGGDGLRWILLAFLAPASYGAMAVILFNWWPRGLDAMQVAFGIALAALVIAAPLAVTEAGNYRPLVADTAALVALTGFAVTLMAEYWLFALVTRYSGAVYASCADFGAIALGLVWAAVFFGEMPTAWMAAAGLLAMGSLAMMKRA